ncbi:MAG: phenylalanine--tRNA ligase subunit alpha [Clostridia bacterium]|nr:phenylalanine--tRNA ligase subunit alpha [Clostridia bacterium]
MKQEIEKISVEFDAEIKTVINEAQLDELRVKYLGKSGKITAIMPMMRTVPAEQKREMGMLINELKGKIESAIVAMQEEFKRNAIEAEINNAERIDITLPVETGVGSLHPRTIVQKEIEDVFVSMGFVVEEGWEVETEYNNFDAVNVPSNHPARDMQDTFWLNNGQVLKTHTSAAQNRILKKYKNNMPIRAIFPGRCFRNEELDAGHENTFFQLEGIIVDENVSVANLIYFMKEMLSRIFKKEVDVRLRPGFFPFTEPSFEMDVRCPYCDGKGCNVCKQGGWIELCPCGMIHPNVLKEAGIDSDKFSGCAFGLGLDRMVMMKMGFNDIRDLNSGNLKIFKQFKVER